MRRTTFYLTDELSTMLEQLSREKGVPQAALIREALEQYGRGVSKARLTSLGAGASHRYDTSERFDDLLFTAEPGGKPKAKRGRRR